MQLGVAVQSATDECESKSTDTQDLIEDVEHMYCRVNSSPIAPPSMST